MSSYILPQWDPMCIFNMSVMYVKEKFWNKTIWVIVLGFNDNPCGSFCVISKRMGEEIVEEMKERDRGERGTGVKFKKQKK